MKVAAIAAVVGCCLIGSAAQAESKLTTVTNDEFVTKAGSAGAAEVALGKLALEKSGNAEVKRFAQMMVTDHQQAGEQLTQVATKEGIQVPAKPDPTQEAAIEQLRAKSGADFDRGFATRMVQDHQEAVTLFEKASRQDDIKPTLRQFANSTLPTLRSHFEHAKQLHTALGADSRQSAR